MGATVTNEGLGSWLGRRRAKSRDAVAVRFNGVDLSYQELADRVDRLAAVVGDFGIRRGDRVAYLGDNHPSFLETLFAAGVLGAVFVPLNTRLAPDELAYMLDDSGSRLLIVSTAHQERAREIAATVPDMVVLVVGDGQDGLEPAMASATPTSAEVDVSLDDPAVILYTSGTTGRPKGAVLTHGNLTWNAINVIVDYDVASTDRALMVSPLFHAASLGMGALPTLLKGATLVLEERFEPGRTLELIEAEQITNLSGVPTTFQMLSDHPRWAVTDLSSLRRITCGGSTIPKRVCLAFEARGLAFTSGYGMTEAAPGATSLSAEHSRAKADSSGLPHFFSRVRVIGVSGESLEVGEIGEVHVGGPNVIREYWGRESAADSFEDGWFRSGDLGYLDAEGFLVITGRVKDMIISGGENIYPIEVERLVDEIPGVRASAVIGVPDPVWGEVPVAVVELVAGASLDVETLRTALSGRLARFKIPRAVIVVDELPRTASGKVRKVELRGQFPTAPSFPETSI